MLNLGGKLARTNGLDIFAASVAAATCSEATSFVPAIASTMNDLTPDCLDEVTHRPETDARLQRSKNTQLPSGARAARRIRHDSFREAP